MSEHLFGKLTRTPGPVRIGASPRDVFATDVLAQSRFYPLASFDLALVRPSWRGTAHFVYLPLGLGSSSAFSLTDEGGLEYRGDYSEYNVDAIPDEPLEWKAPHAALVRGTVPAIDDAWSPSPSAIEACRGVFPAARRECQYWETLAELARAIDPELSYEFFLGGRPRWVQSDETPMDPAGRPLPFVGQVRADLFSDGVAGLALYLFFDEQRRLLVQIAQPD